jgi:hypothetical protein
VAGLPGADAPVFKAMISHVLQRSSLETPASTAIRADLDKNNTSVLRAFVNSEGNQPHYSA